MTELTVDKLKKLLEYDPATGVFTWLVRPCRNIRIGAVAGSRSSHGYRQIRFEGKRYRAHRLAWLYVHGVWPKDELDHCNGVCDDNRIVNLREATHAENQQNRRKNANNASGFMGVSWDTRERKWRVQISAAGRRKHHGYFTSPESAYAAYLAAKAEQHPFQPVPRLHTDGGPR